MKYYLGIDGGGTKTKVAVIDEHENLLYMGESGPSSIDTVENDVTLKNIELALAAFHKTHEDAQFDAIFCGVGGIVHDHHSKEVENLLKNLLGCHQDTVLQAKNDMENALGSGRCFDEGMVLICGTGMVAYGKDRLGHTHKAGGWSFKEGDFGSAYDLGMKALRHVIKAFDDRLDRDDFSDEIALAIQLEKASDCVEIMNQRYLDRTWIANLAPLVTKHANLGNPYAKKIIDVATDDLALAIRAVYKNIKLKEKTLVIVGSLGNSKGYFEKELHDKIKQIDSQIQIIKPVLDPAHAAAIMALKLYK